MCKKIHLAKVDKKFPYDGEFLTLLLLLLLLQKMIAVYIRQLGGEGKRNINIRQAPSGHIW